MKSAEVAERARVDAVGVSNQCPNSMSIIIVELDGFVNTLLNVDVRKQLSAIHGFEDFRYPEAAIEHHMKVLRATCEEDLVGVRPLTQGVDADIGEGSGVEVPNTLSADR